MRKCWNRQTGTFEVRVSMTCGFKSHLPHQLKERRNVYSCVLLLFVNTLLNTHCILLAENIRKRRQNGLDSPAGDGYNKYRKGAATSG